MDFTPIGRADPGDFFGSGLTLGERSYTEDDIRGITFGQVKCSFVPDSDIGKAIPILSKFALARRGKNKGET